MTRRLLRVTLLGGLLCAAHACGGRTTETNPQFGSETHWLGDCRSTGSCADGECICGVCTRSCTAPDGCGGGAPATCVTDDGAMYQAICGQAADIGPGLCVGTCASSSDCKPGMQCVGGACLPEAEQAANTGGAVDVPPDGAIFLGQCLPEGFATESCTVVEAFAALSCDCSEPGRRSASAAAALAALATLSREGACGGPHGPACERLCVCEIVEETGNELEACRNDPAATGEGWCNVEPLVGLGNPMLTENCPPERPALARVLDFRADSRIVVACAAEQRRVGEPCLPDDEERPEFRGFSKTEVNVETGMAECESTLCLAHNFQGRVSCPYGQDGTGGNCRTPTGKPVTAAVEPQLLARRAEDVVHCSCRCAGPEGTGPFCDCPDGMVCAHLIQDLGLGSEQLAGSYCVNEGTVVDAPSSIPPNECNPETLSCGPAEGPVL